MNKPVPFLPLFLWVTLFSAVSCSKDKEQQELQGRWQHDTLRISRYELSVNRKTSETTEKISGNGDVHTLDIGNRNWDWSHTSARTGNASHTPGTYTLQGHAIRVEGHPALWPDYTLRSVNSFKLVLVQEIIETRQNQRSEYEHTFSRVR